MQPGEPDPHQSIASQSETGRACPYCRFPLKEGVQIIVCAVCGAPHHADCWHDNGGCAVIACAGGPMAATGQTVDQAREAGEAPTAAYQATLTSPHMQPAAPPAPPTWPPQQPPPPNQRRGPSLAIAVIVLAIAVGGAAVAVVLSRQGNSDARSDASTIAGHTVTVPAPVTTATTTGPISTAAARTPAGTSPTTATATPGNEGLPAVSSQQMTSEIQRMLVTWHEDVVHSNYHAAWELLSHRKQAQDEREYGYAAWVKNQSTLNPYLDPSGLQVSVEKTEPNENVAQVDVTGMSWTKPGASCTEWSGITWVKYEGGAWRYDPGYSTTPQRERRYKPRYAELLGGRC